MATVTEDHPVVLSGCGTGVLFVGFLLVPGIINPLDPYGWLTQKRERKSEKITVAVGED